MAHLLSLRLRVHKRRLLRWVTTMVLLRLVVLMLRVNLLRVGLRWI
jgi:hypothetical protein